MGRGRWRLTRRFFRGWANFDERNVGGGFMRPMQSKKTRKMILGSLENKCGKKDKRLKKETRMKR